MAPTLFMQDIIDSPAALARTLAEIDATAAARAILARGSRRIASIGSGSSYFACAASIHLYERLAGSSLMSVYAAPAGEFGSYPLSLDSTDAIVGVSASGRVIDVVDLFRSRKGNQLLLGITNEAASDLATVADHALITQAGASRVPTSTKSFLASVAALDALWLTLSRERRATDAEPLADELARVPELSAVALRDTEGVISGAAARLIKCRRFFVLGAGPSWALAQEVALVLKEVAGLVAEPVQSREMIHGPTAVVDSSVGVIGIAPEGRGKASTLESLAQCAAAGATTVSIGSGACDIPISVTIDDALSPLVLGGPLFALANELAVQGGHYNDHPAWEEQYMKAVRPRG